MDTTKRPREPFNKSHGLAFVNKLWEADHLGMFHHPVSDTAVPGYSAAIKSPIDLSTIRKNIEMDKYENDAALQDDVALMISNALEFNEKGTAWFDFANQLRKKYIKMAQEAGLAVDDDAAFIPTKKARDNESTLRKAEAKYGEKFEDVLGDLEKEKEIPLEELRKMYSRAAAAAPGSGDDDSSEGSSTSGDASDEDSDDFEYEEDEEDSEGTSSDDDDSS